MRKRKISFPFQRRNFNPMSKILVMRSSVISPDLNSNGKVNLKLSLQSIRCYCFKYLRRRSLVGRGSSILVLLTIIFQS